MPVRAMAGNVDRKNLFRLNCGSAASRSFFSLAAAPKSRKLRGNFAGRKALVTSRQSRFLARRGVFGPEDKLFRIIGGFSKCQNRR